MHASPVLSVIIPTFNRRDMVVRTVQTLLDQTLDPELFEVIVAVDGSNDGTEDSLKQLQLSFRLNVVQQENRGPAAARNLGAGRASGEYLLFLDDDILADPALLSEHLAAHRDHPGSVVVGPTPLSTESHLSGITVWKNNLYQSDIDRLNTWGFSAVDPYFCIGGNASLSKGLFRQCGGFDESLQAEGDDLEIGLRLLTLGAVFRWNPGASSQEVWVKDDESFSRDRKKRALNEILLLERDSRFRLLSRTADQWTGPWFSILRRRFIAFFPSASFLISSLLLRVGSMLPQRFRLWLEVIAWKGISTATFWKAFKNEFGPPSRIASRFNMTIPILTYHLVRDDLPSCDVVISKEKFETQMRYLLNSGFQCVNLHQWRDWVLYEKPLPPKPVILTFDDGFRDFHENAWPVLKKYGFTATVFLVSGNIGQVNSWDGIAPGKLPLLTGEQIREMMAWGVDFQAHSCTHRSLPGLEANDMRQEIENCRKDLSQLLGKTPDFFAYPYGNFEARERKAVYEAGYLGACTTVPGRNGLRNDLFRLRRIPVSGRDSLPDFRLKLRFGAGFLTIQNLKHLLKMILKDQLGIRRRRSNMEYSF